MTGWPYSCTVFLQEENAPGCTSGARMRVCQCVCVCVCVCVSEINLGPCPDKPLFLVLASQPESVQVSTANALLCNAEHRVAMSALALLPAGFMISAGLDGSLTAWNLRAGKIISRILDACPGPMQVGTINNTEVTSFAQKSVGHD